MMCPGPIAGVLDLNLRACANKADVNVSSPSALWELEADAILLPLSSPAATEDTVAAPAARVRRGSAPGGTFLRDAEEPRGYLSPSLHLLELATTHFTRDPSINS
ncbi:hypothetical protein EYF80_059349 [Liparis tanakae]|uniref:Uncharacterized protein n=1 Tax=Liparis tanakae TaxID=230148 RepID=A0A4Z2EP14_9TELE|nr:hypothetical protein EYF80_059349 [Liparis tanakae]